jgi:hypothetical protein
MDRDQLAAAAKGETVTPERLAEEVVDALEDGEQPHALVTGSSVDIVDGDDRDRLYASVDDSVFAVATDRAVRVIVPQVMGSEVETVAYDRLEDIEAGSGAPRSLVIRSPGRTLDVNVADRERPGELVSFVRDWTRGGTAGVGGSGADGTTGRTEAADGGTDGAVADDGSAAGPTGGADGGDDTLDTLERLGELHEKGVLSDEEFRRKKAELLEDL